MSSGTMSLGVVVLLAALLWQSAQTTPVVQEEPPKCSGGSAPPLANGECDAVNPPCAPRLLLVRFPMEGCDCQLTDEKPPQIRQEMRQIRRAKDEEEEEDYEDTEEETEEKPEGRRGYGMQRQGSRKGKDDSKRREMKKKGKNKWTHKGRLYHRCSCPVTEECD